MAACPNLNDPNWKALVDKIGFHEAFKEFLKHGELVPPADNYKETFQGVNATTKMAKALLHPKAQTLHKAFFNTNPQKFYQELMQNAGATKQQIDLLKDINARTNPQTLNEMVANLLAETSYTVEVKEATSEEYHSNTKYMNPRLDGWQLDGIDVNSLELKKLDVSKYQKDYPHIGGNYYYAEDSNGNKLKLADQTTQQLPDGGSIDYWFNTRDVAEGMLSDLKLAYKGEVDEGYNTVPTSHYSQLTVPGGTNYRENRVVTPMIEPAIKGHAGFAEKNDIGWFRSDDKVDNTNLTPEELEEDARYFNNENVEYSNRKVDNTRRVLEIQSDLFQKGRESDKIVNWQEMAYDLGDQKTAQANSFLQLLNKENSWVTFFVQSIIQDSARRGYEKVLFPMGDTAAKVEGHETLEDYIKYRKARLERLAIELSPEVMEDLYTNQLSQLEKLLKGSQEAIDNFKSRSLSDHPQDFYIRPAITGTDKNFSRIRRNNEGVMPMDLVGDPNYHGWVLQNYTVGEDNPIVKISDARAQELLAKDDKVRLEDLKKQRLHNANRVAETRLGKEEYINNLKESLTNERNQYQHELDQALAGEAKFSSIHDFYENTVRNILNKRGYAAIKTVDEHGNGWYEVTVKPDYKETIFFNRDPSDKSIKFLEEKGLIQEEKGFYVIKPDEQHRSSEIAEQIRDYNRAYYNRNGINPFILHQDADGRYTVVINPEIKNLGKIIDPRGTQILGGVINKLEEQFGIKTNVITDEDAQTLLGSKYQGNERAFFHQGQVYLIDGRVGLDDAFHEYAHPLVMGLRQMNQRVYNDLFAEIQNSIDPTALTILADVRELYPEYTEDSNEFKDEVMVRAIAATASKTYDDKSFGGFLKRLWFRIKELFGKLFGLKTNVSNLSANTTIKDLADMLAMPYTKVSVPVQSDYTLFNRELAAELETIPEHNIIKDIQLTGAVLKEHLSKLANNHNYKELREILRNDSDGSMLYDAKTLIERANLLMGNIDTHQKALRQFASAIVGARMISEKIREAVNIMAQSTMSEQEQLHKLFHYQSIVNEWMDVFENLRQDNPEDLPLLADEIHKATGNLKRVQDYTATIFRKGTLDVLREELRPIKELADKEYKTTIDQLEQKLQDPNLPKKEGEAVTKRVKTLKAEYDKFNLDDEHILQLLRGERGDTNRFSAFLESYTSSPDPIVGGFATYLRKNIYKMESLIQDFSTSFRKELAPHYNALNINRANPASLGEKLVTDDVIMGTDEDGKPYAHPVHVFLNEFHNGWLYDSKALQHKIDKAIETGNKEDEIKARRELNQLHSDYFHREYKDEVYKAKEFWHSSPTAEEAYRRRKEITDELKEYEVDFSQLNEEDLDRVQELQRQLRSLGSTKNLDGTDKTDANMDLEVAKAIQQHKELTRNFYQEYEKKGGFERSMEQFKDDLIDKGIEANTPEYTKALNDWIKENTRTRLTEKFYSDRQQILDRIDAILSKLGPDQAKKLSIGEKWKEIIEQVKGFRDDDGQPIGSDLSNEKIAKVKEIQEQINDLRQALRRVNGLSEEEEERLYAHIEAIENGLDMTKEAWADYNELMSRNSKQLSEPDKIELYNAMASMKDFQTKIPTEYYLDTFNKILQDENLALRVNIGNINEWLSYNNIDAYLEEHPKLKEWFMKNHMPVTKWDNETKQYVSQYERLYVWNRIIPNDATLMTALENNSYVDLLNVKSPYFEVRKARKYYYYRIKQEFRNPKIVGKNVDNRGNWLPRTDNPKDQKYINQKYFDMKNSASTEDKHLFSILEAYKAHHLKVQEGAHSYTRLWMEVPRVRKHHVEVVNETVSSPLQSAKDAWSNIKATVVKAKDDFNRNMLSPEDIKKDAKLYVMTDLVGNETRSIPMRYMSRLEKEHVSMDLYKSVMLYATAIETNKIMHEINPLARALQKTVSDEGIKDLNKISKKNWLTTHMNIFVKSTKNNRLDALSNLMEREIEGIEKKMELGWFGEKIANHLTKLAAFGSLAMNIPNGIKNVMSARIQNVLESTTGINWNAKEWANASTEFFHKWASRFIADYNKFSDKSMQTQMLELFDPVEGKFAEHIGHEGSASVWKDLVDLKFTRSPQTFGELNAQGSAWIAMMTHTKVPMSADGQTTMIPYKDAWEVREGMLRLKEGVDKTWDRDGKEFLAFKAKMHKINELLQGAYSRFNQPEIQRYTLGKLAAFMRKYFAPAFVNRFAPKRANIALGTTREGYYRNFIKGIITYVNYGKTGWNLFTDEEKRNFWKTLAELGYSAALGIILLAAGFNGNNPDKYKKLASMDWAHQMFLYETMMIKSEEENFIPLPDMGANEILRMKDNPSIAFPLINKYYKVISHLQDTIMNNPNARYQKRTGMWEKNQLKLWADLAKIIGYSGNTVHPSLGLKNYYTTVNRYN